MELPWKRSKAPRLPLVEGDKLNLSVLSPRVAAMIKACIGKLDKAALDHGEQGQIDQLYSALPGEPHILVTRGMFGEYGPPVEHIKALPPDPRRK
jgi:hypothetical protein